MMAAMISLVLIVGALGVDLGNTLNRKQLTQNSADFAALAGASGLPTTSSTTVQLVADYLNKNQPTSDGQKDCNVDAGKKITAAMLTDGKTYNGEVTFPSTSRIQVQAPAARVQFGLAEVFGHQEACVSSRALARITSSGIGMTPYYTTTACSTGVQTMKDNSGGLSLPYTVPVLSHDAETNGSTLNNTTSPVPTAIAVQVAGGPDGPDVTINGTNLGAANVNQVGFFNSDQSEPKVVLAAAFVTQTATSITVKVPNAVASYQDVWYIRVHSTATVTPAANQNKWSIRSGALPFQVGEGILSCDAVSTGPSSGNFGSVDIPWGGNDGDDLAANIQKGLRPPTTLVPYGTPLPADNTCQNLTASGSVISTDTLSKENTNCLQSVTGLKAIDAYDGYLDTGGKLITDTTKPCTDLGRPLRRTLTTGEKVNDDLLTCFLKNNTLKLSDAVAMTSTDAVFTQDIWKSPRLVIVPVLDHDPNGTKWMPIKTFVPGFITDQPSGASRLNPVEGTQTENGLITQNPRKLRAIRVFFFDMDALPDPPDGTKLQDYFGTGHKKVTLIN